MPFRSPSPAGASTTTRGRPPSRSAASSNAHVV
jgi:hypothetical protein